MPEFVELIESLFLIATLLVLGLFVWLVLSLRNAPWVHQVATAGTFDVVAVGTVPETMWRPAIGDELEIWLMEDDLVCIENLSHPEAAIFRMARGESSVRKLGDEVELSERGMLLVKVRPSPNPLDGNLVSLATLVTLTQKPPPVPVSRR